MYLLLLRLLASSLDLDAVLFSPKRIFFLWFFLTLLFQKKNDNWFRIFSSLNNSRFSKVKAGKRSGDIIQIDVDHVECTCAHLHISQPLIHRLSHKAFVSLHFDKFYTDLHKCLRREKTKQFFIFSNQK